MAASICGSRSGCELSGLHQPLGDLGELARVVAGDADPGLLGHVGPRGALGRAVGDLDFLAVGRVRAFQILSMSR
jgi:hypothetical protein